MGPVPDGEQASPSAVLRERLEGTLGQPVRESVRVLSRVRAPRTFARAPRGPVRWPALAREEADRAAFLDLGLCSPARLTAAAPSLTEAEVGFDATGDRMVHGDLRSDNICLEAGRVVCRGLEPRLAWSRRS